MTRSSTRLKNVSKKRQIEEVSQDSDEMPDITQPPSTRPRRTRVTRTRDKSSSSTSRQEPSSSTKTTRKSSRMSAKMAKEIVLDESSVEEETDDSDQEQSEDSDNDDEVQVISSSEESDSSEYEESEKSEIEYEEVSEPEVDFEQLEPMPLYIPKGLGTKNRPNKKPFMLHFDENNYVVELTPDELKSLNPEEYSNYFVYLEHDKKKRTKDKVVATKKRNWLAKNPGQSWPPKKEEKESC